MWNVEEEPLTGLAPMLTPNHIFGFGPQLFGKALNWLSLPYIYLIYRVYNLQQSLGEQKSHKRAIKKSSRKNIQFTTKSRCITSISCTSIRKKRMSVLTRSISWRLSTSSFGIVAPTIVTWASTESVGKSHVRGTELPCLI